MAIHLNPGEQVRTEGRIHWITYLRPVIIVVAILVFVVFGAFTTAANNDSPPPSAMVVWFIIAILSVAPVVVRWLQNKSTTYLVTNQRVYIQEGMLSRYSSDIPLEKINDVSVSQSLWQRMLGSGTVTVLTGNDVATSFENLANLEEFRSAVRQK